MTGTADIIVIGGGIAGISVAARLAPNHRVVVLESETTPGYHATGRSAAYFAPAYGNTVVRNLTQLGADFFRSPPDDFTDVPLLHPRGVVFLVCQGQESAGAAMKAENDALVGIDPPELMKTIPVLRPDVIASGLGDNTGGDLDVDAILQGYLRSFRAADGALVTNSRVQKIKRSDGVWHVSTQGQHLEAPIVINAAGAWADEVAKLAQLEPIGLTPCRRTAIIIDPPGDTAIASWPLVVGVEEDFYFKPDAGKLLVSPADETPSVPTDAQPEDLDVAIAVDRISRVTTLSVDRINHRWAGLRTFAPDRTFVAGFDPRTEGFFWLAGQGGYGVQSAPGLSALAAHLVTGDGLPAGYEAAADDIDAVDPARFFRNQSDLLDLDDDHTRSQ